MHPISPRMRLASLAGAVLGAGLLTLPLLDGTEQLGTSSLVIQDGTGLVVGGVGLAITQPGAFNIEIPAGAAVMQVIAYWEGQGLTAAEMTATDTLMVNGMSVTGDRIGGPTHFFGTAYSATYRADVTSLGLVVPGMNAISVSGMDFGNRNNGFGLAVVVDDGSGAFPIDLHDGNDCAFYQFAPPLDTTVPVTFVFAPASVERTGRISHFVSSVFHPRPNVISVSVDGMETERLLDVFGDTAGEEWDFYSHDVAVPAGATSVTVQILSADDGTGRFAGFLPASLTWLFSSFVLAPESDQPGDFEGRTPGFWYNKNNGKKLWDGEGDDDVTTTIKTYLGFNATFGVTSMQSGLDDSITLWDALKDNTNQVLSALNRHASAALVNSDAAGLNFRYTTAEVIQFYQDAVNGLADIEDTKNLLELENEREGGSF